MSKVILNKGNGLVSSKNSISTIINEILKISSKNFTIESLNSMNKIYSDIVEILKQKCDNLMTLLYQPFDFI